MKDSGLRIRVERELRERFLKLCQQQDRPAAQVIRQFMRDYLAEHEGAIDNERSGPALSNENASHGQERKER